MATMNISITDKMKAWVEAKVSEGDYATASDCLRDLVRKRMEWEEQLVALRIELEKGLASGVSDRSWHDLKTEFTARAEAKRLG